MDCYSPFRDAQLRDTNAQLGQLKENLEHMDDERKNLIRQVMLIYLIL